MSEQSDQLKERTMCFSIAVLRLVDRLPRTPSGDVIARQVAKSATSVAANYRAACSARSRRDFVAKLAIVVEEAEESVYWLDLIVHTQSLPIAPITPIRSEANELRAIFSRSLATARTNLRTQNQ